MPIQQVDVTEIGTVARKQLDSLPEASVVGATSRGLFVRLSNEWVIFVSSETFRGPLTLNAPAVGGVLGRLGSGSAVIITPGQVKIPDAGVIIQMQAARSWEAQPPARQAAPPAERAKYLSQVAREALTLGRVSPVSELLPVLLGSVAPTRVGENPIYDRLNRLTEAYKALQLGEIAVQLEALLGLGGGLTPSGDDLIVGFLLTVKRWGRILAPGLDLAPLTSAILPTAYRKTTMLSANLIECALDGGANERLLLALDGILTGEPDPATCAALLASWGNTSGLDALAGMALAAA